MYFLPGALIDFLRRSESGSPAPCSDLDHSNNLRYFQLIDFTSIYSISRFAVGFVGCLTISSTTFPSLMTTSCFRKEHPAASLLLELHKALSAFRMIAWSFCFNG